MSSFIFLSGVHFYYPEIYGFKFGFFKLIVDWNESSYYGGLAKMCDHEGNIYPDSPFVVVQTHTHPEAHPDNQNTHLPFGAQAGYVGLCLYTPSVDDSRWPNPNNNPGVKFVQGKCIDTSCDIGTSAIDVGDDVEGNVGTEIDPVTITWEGMTGTLEHDELPPGLSIVLGSESATITGTPTQIGTFEVAFIGTTFPHECEVIEILKFSIEPCDPLNSEITLGDFPYPQEFEPWEGELTYTDLTDILVYGLPPEITASVTTDPNVITLIAYELPASATYKITLTGTTLNNCAFEYSFDLEIGPCRTYGSKIIIRDRRVERRLKYVTSSYQWYDALNEIISGISINSLELYELPPELSWISLTLEDEVENEKRYRLEGEIPENICELGIPGNNGSRRIEIKLHAVTTEEECDLYDSLDLVVHNCCPDPEEENDLDYRVEISDPMLPSGFWPPSGATFDLAEGYVPEIKGFNILIEEISFPGVNFEIFETSSDPGRVVVIEHGRENGPPAGEGTYILNVKGRVSYRESSLSVAGYVLNTTNTGNPLGEGIGRVWAWSTPGWVWELRWGFTNWKIFGTSTGSEDPKTYEGPESPNVEGIYTDPVNGFWADVRFNKANNGCLISRDFIAHYIVGGGQ